MLKRSLQVLFLISILCFSIQPAFAQSSGPVYIIQPGDTLSAIALRFNVTLDDLMAANPSIDPNFLAEGQQIVIPGLGGVTGILQTQVVTFGDSLRNLSRRTQVSNEQFKKLNRLVSPTELYVGASLIIPMQEGQSSLNTRITTAVGESLLELAIRQGSDPYTLASLNRLNGTWDSVPGDVLYSPVGNSQGNASGLPSAFTSAEIFPLPLVQGGTAEIKVNVSSGTKVSGVLVDRPLNFFPNENGTMVALQGVHALLQPGIHPIKLEAILEDGSRQSFEQMVLVKDGGYYHEDISVDPATIDPAVTEPENRQILSITSPSTPSRYWNGIFTSPAVYPDQFTSLFGTRRTYKGLNTDLVVEGFHTGLDFAGGSGLQITAPASGKVVFSGPLTVRGNATIIDHGWGVYSGFWHQSKIDVQVGQTVDQGQVIGLVGGTGRVTGAHLHWEVWVNGVQVNPFDWLNQVYP